MPLTGPGRLSKSTPDHQQVAATGCQSCRDQHLKCDRVTPVCGRCASNGRECRRGFKFKAIRGSFSRSQKWIRSPTNVTYVDETEVTARNYDPHEGEEETCRPPEAAIPSGHDRLIRVDQDEDEEVDEYQDVSDGPTPASLPAAAAVSSATLDERSPTLATSSSVHQTTPGSPTDRFILHEESEAHYSHRVEKTQASHASNDIVLEDSQPRLYLDRPVLPLKDKLEAHLFRHYTQNLAIWLDLCDPLTSFQTIVPRRAGTCPILLNAIFALAARHLSHTSPASYDHFLSNRYHDICLGTLIPVLGNAYTASDENLFAATIILRVLEEMEVRNVGVDTRGYLLGIHAFVKGGSRHIEPHSLSAAAFWVGLRQEIYSAVMNHQPVRINLGLPIVDRSLSSPAEDYVWANRAVTHCADVLNFCFRHETTGGGDGPSVIDRWDELSEWGRAWRDSLPKSFVPVFEAESSECSPFPEVWYQTSCQVIGVQHNILAELFLIRFDPKIPRIGGRRKPAARRMTNRIQELVRRLCGIGLCNDWSPPALFTACMGVSAFGDRFDNRKDQEAFLEILTLTEKKHARPTEAVQRQMMDSWGWMVDDD